MIPTKIQPVFEIRRHIARRLSYNAGELIIRGDYEVCLHYLLNVMPEHNRLGHLVVDFLMWEIANGQAVHHQPFPEGYTSVRPTSLGAAIQYAELDQLSAQNRGDQIRGVELMAKELADAEAARVRQNEAQDYDTPE